MKKRLCALLCALVLILTVCPATQAAADVCFTAVNDTVLSLSSDTMPVWSGGVLYVPYHVFDAGSTGVSLGISATYSKNSGTVTIFNLRQMLSFDLKQGTCINLHTGDRLHGSAIIRSGRPYVPAARVCSFFGLQPPSQITTDYGPLIRIKNDEVRMDDAQFGVAASASNVLSNRLRDYNQSLMPTEPAVPPAPPQKPVIPEPAEPTDIPTYLAFRCHTGQAEETIADILHSNSIPALFFFSPEEIGRNGDFIRRLLGQGHAVGITALGKTREESFELLQAGNLALETVAHTRTHFALIPPEQSMNFPHEGWIFWNSGLDAVPDGTRSGYAHAAKVSRSLPKRAAAYLILDDSDASAEVMRHLPQMLRDKNYVVSYPRETRF